MQTRTTLSPSYLPALGRSILAPSSQTSLLIVLDLNGVLLERQKNSGKTRTAHAAAKSLRQPSFRLNGHDIWLRPYGDFFLAYVAARHTLGIWSSAAEKTVSGFLSDPRFLPSGAQPFFVHTHDSCIPDTVTGGYATLKPLSAVFTKRYRMDNTLIIDDSPTKVVRDPSNAVIVPEYSAENSKVDYSRDETLLWTALYLEHIATDFRKGEDIREGIQESGGLK